MVADDLGLKWEWELVAGMQIKLSLHHRREPETLKLRLILKVQERKVHIEQPFQTVH